MKAKHRFLASEISDQGFAMVTGREVKHARKVLRLQIGDQILVFNKEGKEFVGKVKQYYSKEDMEVELVEEIERDVESVKDIHLVMGLCRSKKFELALQKCTEIGIASIIPLETSRSILKTEDAHKKIDRWEKIAIDAAKQSTRVSIPEIKQPQDFETFFQNCALNSGNAVMAAVSEDRQNFKDISANFVNAEDLFIIIGPEGGFTDEEVRFAEEKGINVVTLGKRVLRAETAAIYLSSVLFYELGL